MKERRIFIGSFINSPQLVDKFESLQKQLNEKNKIKWTRTPANLHLTYKFIGKTPHQNIKKIEKFIGDKYKELENLKLNISGLNYFSRKGKPAVLYAGISGEDRNKLNQIQQEIEDFLMENGIVDKKEKKFNPHITLGRIKKVENDFYEIMDKNKEVDLGKISDLKIEVIESELSPEGALYKPLKLD